MLSNHEHATLEEASSDLLGFALDPSNWVSVESDALEASPGSKVPAYQRSVGKLKVLASVDIRPNLETHLRVAFRAPGLNPIKAADHLEVFLKRRMPLVPNSEWSVELDRRNWIHFVRLYTKARLDA